jgi:hypothetical protein
MYRQNRRKHGAPRNASCRDPCSRCQDNSTSYQQNLRLERRSDLRTSLLIDAAINTVQSHKLIPVADELIEQGIEPNLVLRVLTMPDKRRCYVEL